MRIALLLGKMSLGQRASVDIANFRTTPGMTGTDTGFARIQGKTSGDCVLPAALRAEGGSAWG